jgi:hypothetical protein
MGFDGAGLVVARQNARNMSLRIVSQGRDWQWRCSRSGGLLGKEVAWRLSLWRVVND